MARSVSEILSEIDNMVIYSSDYDIIDSLLASCDPKTFTIILEAVIDGDLYWHDFERVLANTNYSDQVSKHLSSQAAIMDTYRKMKTYRESLLSTTSLVTYSDTRLKELANISELGISEFKRNGAKSDAYAKEFKNIQDNLLYELTKISTNDNDLSILCKNKLYNMFNSGSGNISVDDIFFFVNDYVIPIDSEYQVLNETDRLFMSIKGLSEEEMKKYKSVKMFLRSERLNVTNNNTNNSTSGGDTNE